MCSTCSFKRAPCSQVYPEEVVEGKKSQCIVVLFHALSCGNSLQARGKRRKQIDILLYMRTSMRAIDFANGAARLVAAVMAIGTIASGRRVGGHASSSPKGTRPEHNAIARPQADQHLFHRRHQHIAPPVPCSTVHNTVMHLRPPQPSAPHRPPRCRMKIFDNYFRCKQAVC